MATPIKVKQAAISGVDSMQVVLENKIPEEYLPSIGGDIPNKIKYENGLTLYKDDTEIAGQSNKVKIKTLNNQSLIGDGDLTVDQSFPTAWPVNGTCLAFLQAIGADTTATPGHTYSGGVEFSDLSDLELGNAEAEVQIINSTLSSLYKIVRLNIYSANTAPYSWSRMYWWKGTTASSSVTDWQITARAANQYTSPVYTGQCTTGGAITLNRTLAKGVYLFSIYNDDEKQSRTYYFAWSGEDGYTAYSADCRGTRIQCVKSAGSNAVLTIDKDASAPWFLNTASVEVFAIK